VAHGYLLLLSRYSDLVWTGFSIETFRIFSLLCTLFQVPTTFEFFIIKGMEGFVFRVFQLVFAAVCGSPISVALLVTLKFHVNRLLYRVMPHTSHHCRPLHHQGNGVICVSISQTLLLRPCVAHEYPLLFSRYSNFAWILFSFKASGIFLQLLGSAIHVHPLSDLSSKNRRGLTRDSTCGILRPCVAHGYLSWFAW
jgi:hypothetical protein